MQKQLPNLCPSCGHALTVRRFGCQSCDTIVEGTFGLPVLARLSRDDQALVVNLIKSSGNLKQLAAQYGVSYPTIRNRLDELIDQIQRLEQESSDPAQK
jgi:hypothetical protein